MSWVSCEVVGVRAVIPAVGRGCPQIAEAGVPGAVPFFFCVVSEDGFDRMYLTQNGRSAWRVYDQVVGMGKFRIQERVMITMPLFTRYAVRDAIRKFLGN